MYIVSCKLCHFNWRFLFAFSFYVKLCQSRAWGICKNLQTEIWHFMQSAHYWGISLQLQGTAMSNVYQQAWNERSTIHHTELTPRLGETVASTALSVFDFSLSSSQTAWFSGGKFILVLQVGYTPLTSTLPQPLSPPSLSPSSLCLHTLAPHPLSVHPLFTLSHPLSLSPPSLTPPSLCPSSLHPLSPHPLSVHPLSPHPLSPHCLSFFTPSLSPHPLSLYPLPLHPLSFLSSPSLSPPLFLHLFFFFSLFFPPLSSLPSSFLSLPHAFSPLSPPPPPLHPFSLPSKVHIFLTQSWTTTCL